MSYTAKGTYNDADVTAADKNKITALQQQYNAAKAAGDAAGMNAAHASAEAIRAGYNYSGGDGSQYLPTTPKNNVTVNTLPSATSQESYVNSLYAASQEKALAALKTAYDENTATINAQAQKIPGIYHDAENQAAANNAIETQRMNEQLAASGLNTGAAGQAALAQSNQYQANMSSMEKAKADALSEVETQRTQLSTQYKNAIAEAIATNNYQKAQALYNEAVRVDESIVNTALNQAQLNYQAQLDTYDRYKNMADTLGQYGNFSGYGNLGYTNAQMESMQSAYNAALSAQGSTGGGGSGGTDWSGVDAYVATGHLAEEFLEANWRNMGFKSYDEAIASYYVKENMAGGTNIPDTPVPGAINGLSNNAKSIYNAALANSGGSLLKAQSIANSLYSNLEDSEKIPQGEYLALIAALVDNFSTKTL